MIGVPFSDADTRTRLADRVRPHVLRRGRRGTGKTTVLVGRIVNLVAAGASTWSSWRRSPSPRRRRPSCATGCARGSSAAAADAGREAEERGALSAGGRGDRPGRDPDDPRVRRQLLRTYPLEAGLPPGFATLDEVEQGFVRGTVRAWFWRDALKNPRARWSSGRYCSDSDRTDSAASAAALEARHDLLRPTPPGPPASRCPRSRRRTRSAPGCWPQRLGRVRAGRDGRPAGADRRRRPIQRSSDGAGAHRGGRACRPARTAANCGLGEHPERWRQAAGPTARWMGDQKRSPGGKCRSNARAGDSHRASTLAAVLELLRDFVLEGVRQRRRTASPRSRTCWPGHATCCGTTPTCATRPRSATSGYSSTSSRTPIRSRRRSPSTWRPMNMANPCRLTGAIAPGAREAVPGRRSQAEHLPLPAGRHRPLRRSAAAAPRCPRTPDAELPLGAAGARLGQPPLRCVTCTHDTASEPEYVPLVAEWEALAMTRQVRRIPCWRTD